MCQRCQRNGYYMIDYAKQRVCVLNSNREIIEILTIDEHIQRIMLLYKVAKEKQVIETKTDLEENIEEHL